MFAQPWCFYTNWETFMKFVLIRFLKRKRFLPKKGQKRNPNNLFLLFIAFLCLVLIYFDDLSSTFCSNKIFKKYEIEFFKNKIFQLFKKTNFTHLTSMFFVNFFHNLLSANCWFEQKKKKTFWFSLFVSVNLLIRQMSRKNFSLFFRLRLNQTKKKLCKIFELSVVTMQTCVVCYLSFVCHRLGEDGQYLGW